MHVEIAPDQTESEILAAPNSPVGACYRFRVAEALRKRSAPVHGVDYQLLADVIDIGVTRTWDTALQERERYSPPFTPKIRLPDGRRSFLPEDLKPEDEAPLRNLAQTSANPFVRSSIFDVLWERFRNHIDARFAIDARVAASVLVDMDTAWFDVTMEL